MTTQLLGKSSLEKVWEKFNDYVSDALMFDNTPSEIAGFPEWAEMHYGVSQEDATNWFCEHAAEQMG
jgi:hypothetical protein